MKGRHTSDWCHSSITGALPFDFGIAYTSGCGRKATRATSSRCTQSSSERGLKRQWSALGPGPLPPRSVIGGINPILRGGNFVNEVLDSLLYRSLLLTLLLV